MIVFVVIYYCYILYREIGTELEPIPTFLLLKCERMVVSRKLNELLTSYLDITSDISKPMILTKAKTMNADWQDFTKQGMYSNAQIYDSNHFTNTKLFLFHFKCSYTIYECMCRLKCLTYFFFSIFAVQSMIFRLALLTEVVLSEFPERWLKNVQVTWKIVAHRRIAILTRYVLFLLR